MSPSVVVCSAARAEAAFHQGKIMFVACLIGPGRIFVFVAAGVNSHDLRNDDGTLFMHCFRDGSGRDVQGPEEREKAHGVVYRTLLGGHDANINIPGDGAPTHGLSVGAFASRFR